jgi:hypothetical protein
MKKFSNSVKEYFYNRATRGEITKLCWVNDKWIVNYYFSEPTLNKIKWEICF